MKFVIVFAALFMLVAYWMTAARKRGKLDEHASKAVAALADAMRYFLYALMLCAGLFCIALFAGLFR
jgi:cbb3-type cytochrome oxidase subunit 3